VPLLSYAIITDDLALWMTGGIRTDQQ